MQIQVSIQASLLDNSKFFVVALYDSSAPSVLLESIAPSKPYGNPFQVTFTYNAQSSHLYIVKLWESVNSSPAGTVRTSCDVTPSKDQITIRGDEYLTADITPGMVSGTDTYTDATLQGWVYSIECIGMGTLYPDTSSNPTPDVTVNIDGWTFLNDRLFQPNEKFVQRFEPQVSVVSSAGDPSPLFSSGQIITADTSLITTDANQALFLQSASSSLTVTLPLLAVTGEYSFFYLYSQGGSHKNATILANGTDTILFNGTVGKIVLGQCETVIIFKANGVWNIASDLQGLLNVGEIIQSCKTPLVNKIWADGTLYNRADYPRLWDYASSLSSGSICSDAEWNTATGGVYLNKCKYSTGDGSTTFRVPLLIDMLLRGVDGSVRFPLSYQVDALKDHRHSTLNGGFPGGPNGHAPTPRSEWTSPLFLTTKPDLTGAAYEPVAANTDSTLSVVADETRVKNAGVYWMICC